MIEIVSKEYGYTREDATEIVKSVLDDGMDFDEATDNIDFGNVGDASRRK